MHVIDFGKLSTSLVAFSEKQWQFYAEAAVALLEKFGHEVGVVLNVEGEVFSTVQLVWDVEMAKSKLRELRDLAEFGAIAIGTLLVDALTEYRVIEQSVIGTGFDYWLGYDPSDPRYDPGNFYHARLEISGISAGTRKDALLRMKLKMRQMEVSDPLKIPALIIVVEFSTPFAITFVK